ncbi:MAG: DNA-binding HxlR family transcriptional regulator [Oceanospirillaceae bacterium]|jgi:DNA-binding HxlR family transcriptional regulator
MPLPFPGSQVRGSKSGKPIMALLDLLGRTWALGVIWHLSQGPATFREIQQRCEQISPSLLNTRLKELKQLHLIELETQGYILTQQGLSLFAIISPLGAWSGQWSQELHTSLNLAAQNHTKN